MVRIITIDREYGSGGNVIAAELAERLGWALWDQRMTDEIARRMECDRRAVEQREERPDSTSYRLFKAFMRGAFEGNPNTPEMRIVDAECIRDVAQAIQLELADNGNCVIVGRGSAYHLGGRSDAFHVFIYATSANKVRRLRSIGKTEAEAHELAHTVDRDRAAFIKRYFGHDWPAIHRFHLMINSCIGDGVAVDTIVDAMRRFGEERA
jgi:cytidylate kinase